MTPSAASAASAATTAPLRPTHEGITVPPIDDQRPSPFDGLPVLIGIPRAAAILGLSRASAYRLAAAGELPVRHLGGRVYVVTKLLREFVGDDEVAA
jgi:hypothetical protein